MKKTILAIMAVAAYAFAASCDYDKAMRNFEKRMDISMSGSKVTKNIASDPEGVSVVQKLSKPIRSGQYMGLRQYLVYGQAVEGLGDRSGGHDASPFGRQPEGFLQG